MLEMGDACDDAESNDTCSCMMMFMLEEAVILVMSERSEHCYGQMLVWCTLIDDSLYEEWRKQDWSCKAPAALSAKTFCVTWCFFLEMVEMFLYE